MTQVVEIQDSAERTRIAETVLRDLPEWFGIEEATRRYIEDAATLPTLAVDPDIGFLCLKQHTPRAAEIYVMGVRRAQHRKGIGRALVAAAESWCRVRCIPYLHVKTLGPSRPDPGYDATRSFYEAVGFVALEELHGLWDENNPTLVARQGRSDRLHRDARRRPARVARRGRPRGPHRRAGGARGWRRRRRRAEGRLEGRGPRRRPRRASSRRSRLARSQGMGMARRIQVILDEAAELVPASAHR